LGSETELGHVFKKMEKGHEGTQTSSLTLKE
jgi:hypothetical protein